MLFATLQPIEAIPNLFKVPTLSECIYRMLFGGLRKSGFFQCLDSLIVLDKVSVFFGFVCYDSDSCLCQRVTNWFRLTMRFRKILFSTGQNFKLSRRNPPKYIRIFFSGRIESGRDISPFTLHDTCTLKNSASFIHPDSPIIHETKLYQPLQAISQSLEFVCNLSIIAIYIGYRRLLDYRVSRSVLSVAFKRSHISVKPLFHLSHHRFDLSMVFFQLLKLGTVSFYKYLNGDLKRVCG